MGINLRGYMPELTKRERRKMAYDFSGKYVVATITADKTLSFFYQKMDDGFVVQTKITPRMYKNKKKAKRVAKRLNKMTNKGEWFIFKYRN